MRKPNSKARIRGLLARGPYGRTRRNSRRFPHLRNPICTNSPISAKADAGNVKLMRELWNDEFLRRLESVPVGELDAETDTLSAG